jgi:hypothetical protein
MQGVLQAKVYGGNRGGNAGTKKLGAYNGGAAKRLGHTNGAIKRLGHTNGMGGGKSNLVAEMYPKY